MKPVLKVDVDLDFPVPVKDADGKEALRSRISMSRPRTAHVKRLAVLIGADFVKQLLGGREAVRADRLNDVDGRELVLSLVDSLFSAPNLDELTAIIASMCNESPDFIDMIDPVDLMKIGSGFIDFFPQLRSIASMNSAQTSQELSDGDLTTLTNSPG